MFRFQRAWLEKHGVVKSKTANTRDELLDLMARNYYGARDTSAFLSASLRCVIAPRLGSHASVARLLTFSPTSRPTRDTD